MPHNMPLSLSLSVGRSSDRGLRCMGQSRRGQAVFSAPGPNTGQGASAVLRLMGASTSHFYHRVQPMLEELPKLWSTRPRSSLGRFPCFPPGLWGQHKLGLRCRQELDEEKKKGRRKKTQAKEDEKEAGWGMERQGEAVNEGTSETGMKESSTLAPWHGWHSLTCKGQDTCSPLWLWMCMYSHLHQVWSFRGGSKN